MSMIRCCRQATRLRTGGAARHWARRHGSDNNSISDTYATGAAASAAVDAASIAARARRLRREAFVWCWLRRLVVPGFTAYGLFLLRPTESQFVRYLAERRYYDAAFDQLFPPVQSAATTRNTTAATTSTPTRNTPCSSSSSSSVATAQDYMWYTRRLKVNATDDDVERLARRRRMFSSDAHTPLQGDSEGATHVSTTNKVPLHELSAHVQAQLMQSKQYRLQQQQPQQTQQAVDAPTVDIDYNNYKLFALGQVHFRDTQARELLTLRFVGVCGTLWKELARHMADNTQMATTAAGR